MLSKLGSSWCLVALTLVSVGCRGKAADPAAKQEAAASNGAAASAVDEALVAELKTIGKTCQKAPGEERFKCANGQNWKIIGDFMGKRRDRATAVGALAKTLLDAEPGVRGLTASVLHSAFGGVWGRDGAPPAIPSEAAQALLDGALKQPAPLARQVMPAAVNAAMLGGQADALYAALAKPEHAALRASAYPYLMTMGRMRAFPMVRKLVKGSEPSLAEAAAEAPLNMDAWTEAEQEELCEWADGLLEDERSGVAAKANLLLSQCSGARLDKLLARADRLEAARQLDTIAQGPLIAMCGGAQRPPKLAASAAQCERARVLLEKVAQSGATAPAARVHAVNWVAQIWPDDRASRFLVRLQRDSEAGVARQARDSFRRLSEASAQLASAQAPDGSTPNSAP